MGMQGYPLACFTKPVFEDDGLEFFVCNGGGGIAGVRRKGDRTGTVYVRDQEIAMNLNMKAAKAECGQGKFFVRSDPHGAISFGCEGKEIRGSERFQPASSAQWKKWATYLK